MDNVSERTDRQAQVAVLAEAVFEGKEGAKELHPLSQPIA